MKFYNKLKQKKTYWAALELKKAIPELKNIDSELLGSYLNSTKLEFYEGLKAPVKVWLRFTMPFAIITILLMLVFMPVVFIITGIWGYRIKWIINWFRSIGF